MQVESIVKITAYGLAFLILIWNGSLFIRLKPPYSFYFVIVQLLAGALSPFLAILGGVGAGLGWLTQAPAAVAAGVLGAAISIVYIVRVTITQPDLATAFGKDWEAKIAPFQKMRLSKPGLRLGLPETSKPIFEPNISFWTIPGTDRELLCDIWQPAEGEERSGLAIVYLHGSAWYFLDKDMGTRPLFTQLTASGHVVMDVAYRLTPEVDIYGMVADPKRAVAWMKANARRYGVDPEWVVLAGGSAGGHLALMAAYTPNDPRLTPSDLDGCDVSVRAVVSMYGPTDLRACYQHLDQKRLTGLPKVEIGQPGAATMEKKMVDAGRIDTFLGGHLHEVPEMYALASPVTHVHAGSPITLLIQGEPDVIAPAVATCELRDRLVEQGVPVVNIIYPWTNHAFDLLLPQVSPAAQAAIYEVKRFLALVSCLRL